MDTVECEVSDDVGSSDEDVEGEQLVAVDSD